MGGANPAVAISLAIVWMRGADLQRLRIERSSGERAILREHQVARRVGGARAWQRQHADLLRGVERPDVDAVAIGVGAAHAVQETPAARKKLRPLMLGFLRRRHRASSRSRLAPPEAGNRLECRSPLRIQHQPSAFHVPPARFVDVDMTASVWGGPPARFTAFSFPSGEKSQRAAVRRPERRGHAVGAEQRDARPPTRANGSTAANVRRDRR